MNLLLPWALLGLATVAGLVAAYLLQVRHKPRRVSALFLWQGGNPARVEGRRRDRLRTPPIFFVELLALAALAVAAAHPFLHRGAPPAPSVVFDTTPSMRARLPDGSSPASRALAALRDDLDSAGPLAVRLYTSAGFQGLLPPAEAIRRCERAARAPWDPDAPAVPLPSLIALAHSRRATGGTLLAYTDRRPDEDAVLPPGTRYRAFGEPVPNNAIAYAVRRRTADGGDSLLLRLAAYPDGSAFPSATLRAAISGGDAPALPAIPDIPSPVRVVTLPPGTPEITVAIPDDALADDNAVRIPPPSGTSPSALLGLPDGHPLRPVFERALRSAGAATPSDGAEPPALRIEPASTNPPALPPPRVLLTLHPVRGYGRARPVMATSHPLLEGLSFAGLAWAAPEEPLPGTPILYAGTTPAITEEAPLPGATRDATAERRFHLLAPPPAAPLYRSPAFPALVWNLLALAGDDAPAPRPFLPADESDLGTCTSCDLREPPAISPVDLDSTRSLAAAFGLFAIALMLLRLRMLRRSAKPRAP